MNKLIKMKTCERGGCRCTSTYKIEEAGGVNAKMLIHNAKIARAMRYRQWR